MAEYIYEIESHEDNESEIFIGWIRNHSQELVRCKDCKYYKDGDCWHEWDNDGQMYYQSVINEPNPEDYCSKADGKEK